MCPLKYRWIAGSLLSVLVATMLLASVYATVSSFTVNAGETTTRPLDLSVDDHVVVKVSVLGDEGDSTIDFYIAYPNGTVMQAFGQTGNVNYPFVCDVEGRYTLNFSNTVSSHNKFVTLDYEIDHYILGMPQMFFLVMIIGVLCVAAVAVFILMGRQH